MPIDSQIIMTLLAPEAMVPRRMSTGAAAYDLFACLPGGSIHLFGGQSTTVPTGVAVELPKGTVGLVCPRSGLAKKHQVTVLNAPGVIDEDYRGEIQVLLVSHARFDVMHTICHGDRIAQLVVAQVVHPEVVLVSENEVSLTDRGRNGFGSTGV